MPAGETNNELIVYKRRWFILLVVAGLNITNGALWISFAPISNIAATYYNVSNDTINWLSIIFFVTAIPVGILATALSDRKGLRFMIHVGAWSNLLGACLRVFADLSVIPVGYRFPLTMTGQTIAAIAQPFVFMIPTRVSEIWFPEHQRTLATTVISMANPFGTGIGTLLSPFLVNLLNPNGIYAVNVVWACSAIIFAFATFICVCASEPPSPPSSSAKSSSHTQSYLVGLKQLCADKHYILLLFTLGVGIGLFNCVQTLIDQFLCPTGYLNDFAGICGALITGCGMIGAVISSVIADKTRLHEEVSKICFAFAAVSASIFAVSLHVPYNPPFVAISCALFGFFGFAGFPVSLELAAEGTYPVNEVISAGFIIMCGQLQGIIYVLLFGSIGKSIPIKKRIIKSCTQSLSVSSYCIAGILVFTVCAYILFYKADYKRRRVEDFKITTSILSSDSSTNSNSLADSVTICS